MGGHEGEIRVLVTHNSRTGAVMGTLILLAYISRTNEKAGIRKRGWRNWGVWCGATLIAFFNLHHIWHMQKRVKEYTQIFPEKSPQTDFLDGDLSVNPPNGERGTTLPVRRAQRL